ncbi:unnamed protein product [Caenorhabditis nigoni]
MLKKRIRSLTQIRETVRNGPVTDRKPSGHRNGSDTHSYRYYFFLLLGDGWFAELSELNTNILLSRCSLIASKVFGVANLEIREYVGEDFFETFGINSTDVNMVAALYSEGSTETTHRSWKAVGLWSLISGAPVVAFFVFGRLDIHSYRYCFFLMLSDGRFVEFSDYHSHILIARCSLILSSYAVLMSHFIYRYLVIHNSSFTKKRFPLFMIGSFIILAVVFSTWHFLCWTIGRANTEIREYIREDFREIYGKDSMNFNMLAALYREGSDETVTQSWIATFFWTLICTAPIIGFMVLGRMIIVKLRKTTSIRMSHKTSQFQVELLRALAVQTLIPICISFLPAVLCWYTPMLGIQLGRTFNYFEVSAFGVFAVIDPVAIILCIPIFRRRIFSKHIVIEASISSISGK